MVHCKYFQRANIDPYEGLNWHLKRLLHQHNAGRLLHLLGYIIMSFKGFTYFSPTNFFPLTHFLEEFAMTLLICCHYVGLTTATTLALSFSRYLVGQPEGTCTLYVNTTISVIRGLIIALQYVLRC